jgi:cellulose synthase/poly-beta-1,6-N-acetylglucosamine synthase-like glycosyltransferase
MVETGNLDPLLYLVLLLPLFLVAFDGIHRLAFLLLVHFPGKRGPWQPDSDIPESKLLVLIAAHNEESGIGATLERIRDQVGPAHSTTIVVLADHCSDQTAAIANESGASVYVRTDGPEGKGPAFSWFVQEGQPLLVQTDIVAVLDADTLVDSEFCNRIRGAFRPGVDAVQGFVNPLCRDGFPMATLVSYSEILAQRIDDTARARLNWSVPLRGTGMAFRTEAYCQACKGLETQVDDIELSVRLAEAGLQVHFNPSVIVRDPKSNSLIGLARQRARWLRGQRQIWREQWTTIVRLLRAGPPSWSLIHALLLKPKTALGFIKAVLIGILALWPFHDSVHGVVLFAVLGTVLVDLGYYISGLAYVSPKGKYVAALAGSPLLMALWGISWIYSVTPAPGWLRARRQ